ncbi:hypothetical protein MA16_Dca014435 [Dendrobium catenatum]|uniref:Uncharacterized protein n=1 Tax=Dendrobium catenatum TaxID=906689 RepID=A0A2I0VTT4_9ASPA|nr:hypothetical protein MA16_Dca014435 [Dendrobium catenatum]
MRQREESQARDSVSADEVCETTHADEVRGTVRRRECFNKRRHECGTAHASASGNRNGLDFWVSVRLISGEIAMDFCGFLEISKSKCMQEEESRCRKLKKRKS